MMTLGVTWNLMHWWLLIFWGELWLQEIERYKVLHEDLEHNGDDDNRDTVLMMRLMLMAA